ncbi:MAG: myxococcus cysteine-rich repeat containing protein, partial [Nanoarchaeota archaeon]
SGGSPSLYHAYYNAQGNWVNEEMKQILTDTGGGNGGIGNFHIDAISVAIDPTTNKPAVLYYQSRILQGGSGQGLLYYLHYENNQWVGEIVTTSNIYYGVAFYPGYRQPSIDINKNGKARISFFDKNDNLIYGQRKSDGTWVYENVDTGIGNLRSTFIKVNQTNNVHIVQNRKHYSNFSSSVIFGQNEICNNGLDDDINGLIDYADPFCSNSCLLPSKITFEKAGLGAGAPWTPPVYNSSYAGCCLTTQCYYYVDSSDYNCVNADVGITKFISGNLINSYCKVNGNSAVWCKTGYINNGTGGCILSSMTNTTNMTILDQGGNFSMLECNINPVVATYHGFLGGTISLWTPSGAVYQSPNGTGFNKLLRYLGDSKTGPVTDISFEQQGLPREFKPTTGFYYNFSSGPGISPGGVFYIFNSSGFGYKTYPNGSAPNWTTFYGVNKTNAGLPLNYIPTVAYYHGFGGSRINLWDATGILYATANGTHYARVLPTDQSQTGLPSNYIPVAGYYQNNSYSNGGFATLFNSVGLAYKTTNGNMYPWNTFTPTGLPVGQGPSEGYFDIMRNKSVVWYGTDAYQSSNGIDFFKVNTTHLCINPSSSCGNRSIDLGETCDDGNTNSNDGCSSSCIIEGGYECTGQPSVCNPISKELRRTCNDILDQPTCEYYQDPSNLTDLMKASIQDKSLISNNFCFDPIYTFEPDLTNGGIAGDPATCGTYIACSCYWSAGKCEEKTFRAVTNPGLCILTPTTPLSTCVIKTTTPTGTNACSNGQDEYLINWTASWNLMGENATAGCVAGEKMLPCPKSTNISFFNWINLAIAILIIIVLYYLIVKKSKRGKYDRKRKKR